MFLEGEFNCSNKLIFFSGECVTHVVTKDYFLFTFFSLI
uniref:Uncharacterized protein n=1 Tax=Arundo donax TaxID=35708 RepID=A0A0A8Y9U8_ARUDO